MLCGCKGQAGLGTEHDKGAGTTSALRWRQATGRTRHASHHKPHRVLCKPTHRHARVPATHLPPPLRPPSRCWAPLPPPLPHPTHLAPPPLPLPTSPALPPRPHPVAPRCPSPAPPPDHPLRPLWKEQRVRVQVRVRVWWRWRAWVALGSWSLAGSRPKAHRGACGAPTRLASGPAGTQTGDPVDAWGREVRCARGRPPRPLAAQPRPSLACDPV